MFIYYYKSIVCEEESYLLELVWYIHLNPMRVGVAKTVDELDAYPFSGHSVIIGKIRHKWQDREYVLRQGDMRRRRHKSNRN